MIRHPYILLTHMFKELINYAQMTVELLQLLHYHCLQFLNGHIAGRHAGSGSARQLYKSTYICKCAKTATDDGLHMLYLNRVCYIAITIDMYFPYISITLDMFT